MTYSRLLNTLFHNRKKHTEKKVKNFTTELPIFENKVKKLTRTIKYTQSPQTIIKNFDTIREEFIIIMSYDPPYDLEFNGQVINDIQIIDTIRDQYIKDFLNGRIDIELEKMGEVDSLFLKEGLIKKAIGHALKAVEYIPNDVEIRLRINELENKLLGCYKND